MKEKIIFIHGFGVKKDARGMFTDIANSLPEYTSIFTDLNEIDAEGNIHLNPLHTQSKIISEVYKREVENSEITVIAHSQGCVVASLADLPNVKKIILLAPPTNNDLEKTINSFKQREGTIINLEGVSTLMRKDGSKTFVPKEYWNERKDINYLEEYTKLSARNELFIIIAKQDEVVSNGNKLELAKLGKLVEVSGNHNFEGVDRQGIINEIKSNL